MRTVRSGRIGVCRKNAVADQRDAWEPSPDLLDRARPFNSVERPEDRNNPVAWDHVREDQDGVAVLAAGGVDGAEKARADKFPMPSLLSRRQRIEKFRRLPDLVRLRLVPEIDDGAHGLPTLWGGSPDPLPLFLKRRRPESVLSSPATVWKSGDETITGGAMVSLRPRPGAPVTVKPAGEAPSRSSRERTPTA